MFTNLWVNKCLSYFSESIPLCFSFSSSNQENQHLRFQQALVFLVNSSVYVLILFNLSSQYIFFISKKSISTLFWSDIVFKPHQLAIDGSLFPWSLKNNICPLIMKYCINYLPCRLAAKSFHLTSQFTLACSPHHFTKSQQ